MSSLLWPEARVVSPQIFQELLDVSEGTFARRSSIVRFLTVITSAYTTMRKLPGAQNFSDVPGKPPEAGWLIMPADGQEGRQTTKALSNRWR